MAPLHENTHLEFLPVQSDYYLHLDNAGIDIHVEMPEVVVGDNAEVVQPNCALDSSLIETPQQFISGPAVIDIQSKNQSLKSGRDCTVNRRLENKNKFDLINKPQEQALSKAIQSGIAASGELDKLPQRNTPAINKKRGELNDAIAKGKVAEDKFFHANLRLVVSIAKRHNIPNSHLELSDLIQEGNIGLLTAVKKFKPDKNTKFSSYATLWISEAMRKAINSQELTVRKPRQVETRILQMRQVKNDLLRAGIVNPSSEEIASASGISVERVTELSIFAQSTVSLDKQVYDFSESNSYGLIPSDLEDVHDTAARNIQNEELAAALRQLTNLEREAFLHANRDYRDKETLDEITTRLGINAHRIRTLALFAVEKLRHPSGADNVQNENVPWTQYANCSGAGLDLFFPSIDQNPRQDRTKQAIKIAREFCRKCEVVIDCKEYGEKTNIRFGLWGGYFNKKSRIHKKYIDPTS